MCLQPYFDDCNKAKMSLEQAIRAYLFVKTDDGCPALSVVSPHDQENFELLESAQENLANIEYALYETQSGNGNTIADMMLAFDGDESFYTLADMVFDIRQTVGILEPILHQLPYYEVDQAIDRAVKGPVDLNFSGGSGNAGHLTTIIAYNPNNVGVFLKFWDTNAVNVNFGTTPVDFLIYIPAQSQVVIDGNSSKKYFDVAMAVAATTGYLDNNTTLPTDGVYLTATRKKRN